MKPIWRILLAVTLGLAVSIYLARCLAPGPILTLHYQESGIVSLPDPKVPVAGFSVQLDKADRLIVRRPNYPEQGLITLEHFALRTDRTPRSTIYTADSYVARPEHSDTAEGWYLLHGGAISSRVRSYEGFERLRQIPSSSQSIRIKYVSMGIILDRLNEIPIIGPWLFRDDVGIWDNQSHRFLWSVPCYRAFPDGDRDTTVITNESEQYVVVVQTIGEQHTVSVLHVPMDSFSPWWHRIAGFLTFIAVLMIRKRSTHKRPYQLTSSQAHPAVSTSSCPPWVTIPS